MSCVRVTHKDPLCYYDIAMFIKDYIKDNTVIVCIGTDMYIPDCLGPLVGTILKEKHFNLPVYGTIAEPIHALNIHKTLEEISITHPDSIIIGVDACLGDADLIGYIQAGDFPVRAGRGTKKLLPKVGVASIVGIVDTYFENELSLKENVRLHLIMKMANAIAEAIMHSQLLNNGFESVD